MRIFIFGMGYTATVIAARLAGEGWSVAGTGRGGAIDFADGGQVRGELARADAVLSSVPPAEGADPVLAHYGADLAAFPGWLGYLSSTGVYGDTRGAWVDESAPVVGLGASGGAGGGASGRRHARGQADADWLARGARVFRLPGIYGVGRSALDRVRGGRAHRIDLADQVFSRVHVDDIAAGVRAALIAPPGAYNLADDLPCSQNAVIEEACRLLGRAPPPLQTMDEANLSPMARGFYAENRRVANGKAKRVLGWHPRYPTYREGLAACLASDAPDNTSGPRA